MTGADRTFLLCVGTQKAGTSWLHQYFLGHPQFAPGFLKECHVFDCLYAPGFENRKRKYLATASALAKKKAQLTSIN